jgi:hypothetical protein
MDVIFWYFPGRTEENHKPVRIADVPPEIGIW